MLTKTQLNNTLNKLPNEFTIDTLINELILVEKIQKAEDDSLNNRIKSQEETEKIINLWF
jgi:hypothetical protein